MKELPVYVSHGSPNAYNNYGCRCFDCRVATSYYRIQLRAKNPEKYTNYMREYMVKYRARKKAERQA